MTPDDPTEPPDIHGPTDADFDLSIEDALAAIGANDLASRLPQAPEGWVWEIGTMLAAILGGGLRPQPKINPLQRPQKDDRSLYARSVAQASHMREIKDCAVLVPKPDSAADHSGRDAWYADIGGHEYRVRTSDGVVRVARGLVAYQRLCRELFEASHPPEAAADGEPEHVDRGRGAGTHLRETQILGIDEEGEPSADDEPERLPPNAISPRSLHARRRREEAARKAAAPSIGTIKRGE
ncbi:MAG TPA: hypothetical protein VN802_01915 [Stellaceae bacterium]|nr:hypothetical protein [Stellaceae bacterium]